MFLATYKDYNGTQTSNLYTNTQEFFTDTFCPYTKILEIIDFTVKGKNYKERKANAEQIGIDFSNSISSDLSYMEYAIIGNKLEAIAKRYGLTEEFRENALI